MNEVVPGEEPVGLLEKADPRAGVVGRGLRPVIKVDVPVRADRREPEEPERGQEERLFSWQDL